MKSMLFPSLQTDTGSVLPLVPLSRFGIWNKRSLLKNLNQKSWDTKKVPHQCALHSAGAIIKIWDLEQKVIVEELKPEVMGHKEGSPPVCTSLCWCHYQDLGFGTKGHC